MEWYKIVIGGAAIVIGISVVIIYSRSRKPEK
jgi:hypothetical protein